MADRYTVTVFVAAPGTPLRDGSTSAAGHLYYQISNGESEKSYGFSPQKHGVVVGPGRVSTEDAQTYQSPFYGRTMEITENKYNKLRDFGEAPGKYAFDLNYNGATNSCIDFT